MKSVEPIAPPAALQLEGVGVLRGERWILRDLSWTVPAGRCVAVVGPNGSGKSTLARLIMGYLWATRGTIHVAGRRFGETNMADVRRTVRLVQPAGPFDVDETLTTRQVVLTGRTGVLGAFGKPEAHEDLDHARRLIDLVGLGRLEESAYRTLSTGERLRALTARAVFARPSLLILDEPTNGLDLLAREQLLSVVDRLVTAERDRPTVVVITHHLEELPRSTSEVMLLGEGTVAAQGPPAAVLRDEVMSAVYGCDVRVTHEDGRYAARVNGATWAGLLE